MTNTVYTALPVTTSLLLANAVTTSAPVVAAPKFSLNGMFSAIKTAFSSVKTSVTDVVDVLGISLNTVLDKAVTVADALHLKTWSPKLSTALHSTVDAIHTTQEIATSFKKVLASDETLVNKIADAVKVLDLDALLPDTGLLGKVGDAYDGLQTIVAKTDTIIHSNESTFEKALDLAELLPVGKTVISAVVDKVGDVTDAIHSFANYDLLKLFGSESKASATVAATSPQVDVVTLDVVQNEFDASSAVVIL